MHYRCLRDSFFGRLTYHISGKKWFQHPEEQKGYIIPEKYLEKEKTFDRIYQREVNDNDESSGESSVSSTSATIATEKIIVTWDSDDDPENPYNWPIFQKVFLITLIAFLTTSVYMGAAIFTPGIDHLMEDFNITRVQATLPLTMFVIGYGLGPMVFSPMSENAIFGRTSIYIVTLFIFVILQIPTALSTDIAGLTVLRFLSGFFASPCLATGGASISDVLGPAYSPLGIAAWSMAAVCGPSLGPLVGSVLVVKGNWRWTFWFMGIISGVSLIVLTFLLPETYGNTLLLRKAKRLRALTGDDNITTEEEIANADISVRQLVVTTLWRPMEISIVEPVVLLINLFIALVYSVLYLWFEAFPIVFLEAKHFTLVELGVSYVSIMLGIIIACAIYIPVVIHIFTKRVLKNEVIYPEVFIPTCIVGSVLMPIGIFIFGWTSSPDIHWMGPMVGGAIFAAGAFLIFQTLFNYLGKSFKGYIASVFAGNALFRSVIAGVFPLFGAPLFNNLGTEKYPVGWGSSILGFIAIGMIAIPVLFYLNGPKLRARSKYAIST